MKAAILLLVILSVSLAGKDADLIKGALPGCSDTSFKQYSGYLDVTNEKKFHYVLVESENSPATDPVMFWFNGGPGCSSMIGFIQEHGPCAFMQDSDHAPSDNPYSFNKFANVVYLESPAGVGFNHFSGSFHYDDENVSYENLKAVQEFFERFPELKANDLYLSGESYGGIYIPYLALRIDEHNKEANEKINLKGFMIGNGVTNWKYDTTPAFVQMAFAHGLIGIELHNKIEEAQCDFSEFTSTSSKCRSILSQFNTAVAKIYPYDIYRVPEDYYTTPNMGVSDLISQESDSSENVYGSFAAIVRNNVKKSANDFAPVNKYMNSDELKTALNIPVSYSWAECSGIDYEMLEKATQWIYPELKGRYRMMHYSGTTDGVVPTIGTEQWMEDLGWKITEERTAWMADPKLIGGYTQTREGNLDFITIHGSGHMAPQWKREASFVGLGNWIQGKELPRA